MFNQFLTLQANNGQRKEYTVKKFKIPEGALTAQSLRLGKMEK
jgi:hypothetical protein